MGAYMLARVGMQYSLPVDVSSQRLNFRLADDKQGRTTCWMPNLDSLPDEILRIIAQLVYLDHLPRSLFRCIDPHGLPSTYPSGKLISSTQQLTQSTLHSLCLTNSRLYHAAKPLLWRRLQITLPYSFLLLLRSLGASKLAEAYEEQHAAEKEEGFAENHLNPQMNVNAMIAAVGLARATGKSLYVSERYDFGETSRTQDVEEPMDLVWEEELQKEGGSFKPRYHVTFRHDDSDLSDVHKHPRVLDFSTYRTQGMRRTVGEGQESRFVTPAKLLALITATSDGLMAFGASSTMDSALSVEVLEALLFRDGDMTISPHHSLRGVSMERSRERDRRRPRRLESLDLCNCVSRYFEAALAKFVEKHLRKFSGRTTATVQEEDSEGNNERAEADEGERRGRARSRGGRDASQARTISRSISMHRSDSGAPSKHPARATLFPSVQRLGLAGIHFSSDLLHPFVLAFPRLTHLDLSGTKIDDTLLQALAASQDLELESLSLARCTRISSECLTELLVDSAVCSSLLELSIEGTLLFPTPITKTDLETVITTAPFMRSGSLRYLDLGACGMDDDLLKLFPPQPSLLDLGLSASPQLSLAGIAQFLIKRAPNVQVLELVDSCQSRSPLSIVHLNTQLLDPCSTLPPLSISEQLAAMGFSRSLNEEARQSSISHSAPPTVQAKTNLRVVGLSVPILKQIHGALGNWCPVLGAGRRGWLVDVSSGPDPEAIDEDLEVADDEAEEGQDQSRPRLFLSPPMVPAKRGRRQDREYGTGSWEPETPPRRLSRSPSMSRRKSLANSLIAQPATARSSPGGSRSRSRQPPSGPAALTSSPGGDTERLTRQERAEGEDGKEAEAEPELKPRAEVIRGLSNNHPRRLTLERLSRANGHVVGTTGWHSKKMEVLLGMGMLGRESGSFAYAAYQT